MGRGESVMSLAVQVLEEFVEAASKGKAGFWEEGFGVIDTTTLAELRAVDTPEKSRARSRAWKERNRERVAAYSRARYLAKKRTS